MMLTVYIDSQAYPINVPDNIVTEASDYFDMMDKDMENGYQMSRFWVQTPDLYQRCQIAADHILTALETDNEKTATLMSAYILNRLPGSTEVHLNITGDMNEHEIVI